jgi:hypothetical protein
VAEKYGWPITLFGNVQGYAIGIDVVLLDTGDAAGCRTLRLR